jgi:aminomethyltransferase
MRRSPLHEVNQALGARFTDFGGWEMPLQYESVLAEHRAVRTSAGVFDVTHLGRFELTGPGAHVALRRLLCNDINRITPGRCQYTLILNMAGGIIDDLIVWWWEEDRYWVMPNAANHERVMAAFAGESGCEVTDLREETVLLAVQGPEAPATLTRVLGQTPTRMKTIATTWEGTPIMMAGTGYTGEPGGEVCVSGSAAGALLTALIDEGVAPCGLGARDTLRLEAGLTLWGQDIDETTTPLEADLGFAVSFDHEFVGHSALARQTEQGLRRRLVGFVLEDRGVPRHGYSMRSASGGIGTVTSGNISPMLGHGVGLGYLSPPPVQTEEPIEIEVRQQWLRGRLKRPPFHT